MVDRRENPVEELADRLAAEEALGVRDDSPECLHELLLELVGGDRGQPVAAELAQLGPRLDLGGRCDDARRLDRARERAREDAVELDRLE